MSDSQSRDHGFESRTEYMKNKWIKSSECGSATCVEVKINNHLVEVRDTSGEIVMYTHAEWAAFVKGVKNGEFDLWVLMVGPIDIGYLENNLFTKLI